MSKSSRTALSVVPRTGGVAKSTAQASAKTAAKAAPIVAAASAVTDVVDAVTDYGKVRQQERTKRAHIAAEERVAVRRIRAQERLLKKTIDGELRKQDRAITAGTHLLEHAMATGNDDQVALAVKLLLETVQQDPLRAAQHLMGAHPEV